MPLARRALRRRRAARRRSRHDPSRATAKSTWPSENGRVYVVEAGPVYKELAVNEMTESTLATPAISDGVLLIRTQAHLLAIDGRGRD
jgi:hypothetical protein